MRQKSVSVTPHAHKCWVEETGSPVSKQLTGEQLQLIRRLVNERWPKREAWRSERHPDFFLVPVTTRLWAVCTNDKRPSPNLHEGVVVNKIVSEALIENKASRMQWEKVEA